MGKGKKKIAPIVTAVLVVLYVGPLVVMMAAAAGLMGASDAAAVVPFFLRLFAGQDITG